MFFSDYKNHAEAKLNPNLFWEYDMRSFDFNQHATLVVERVVERGASSDFYAIFNLFGEERVYDIIKRLPCLSQRELEFVKNVFHIPYEELTAYKNLHANPGMFKNGNLKIRI